MIRPVLMSAVMATLAVSACGDSDDDDQASTDAPATSTTLADSGADGGVIEAWCLEWASPLPDVETPISNDDLQLVFETMQAQREAMLEVAPAEIAETNRAVVEFGRELNAHLADNGWDPNAPRIDGASDFDVAQGDLSRFGDENC